jgi:hypothetical protein
MLVEDTSGRAVPCTQVWTHVHTGIGFPVLRQDVLQKRVWYATQ